MFEVMARPRIDPEKKGDPVTVRLPHELLERLEALCQQNYWQRTVVVQRAVEILLADGLEEAARRVKRGRSEVSEQDRAEIRAAVDGGLQDAQQARKVRRQGNAR